MRDHAPRHENGPNPSPAAGGGGGPKRRDSHARVRTRGVEEDYLAVLEEFGDEQLTMTVNVMCVDHIIDGVGVMRRYVLDIQVSPEARSYLAQQERERRMARLPRVTSTPSTLIRSISRGGILRSAPPLPGPA